MPPIQPVPRHQPLAWLLLFATLTLPGCSVDSNATFSNNPFPISQSTQRLGKIQAKFEGPHQENVLPTQADGLLVSALDQSGQILQGPQKFPIDGDGDLSLVAPLQTRELQVQALQGPNAIAQLSMPVDLQNGPYSGVLQPTATTGVALGSLLAYLQTTAQPSRLGEIVTLRVQALPGRAGGLSYNWKIPTPWSYHTPPFPSPQSSEIHLRAPQDYDRQGLAEVEVRDANGLIARRSISLFTEAAPTLAIREILAAAQPSGDTTLTVQVNRDSQAGLQVLWDVAGTTLANSPASLKPLAVAGAVQAQVQVTEPSSRESASGQIRFRAPSQNQWPVYHGDRQRTGQSTASIAPLPQVAWRYLTGASVVCTPCVGPDGTIYFGSDDGKFYALNPNGTSKWVFNFGSLLRSSPALLSDGSVVFGCEDGNLYSISPQGAQQWVFRANGPINSAPMVASNDLIVFGSDSGTLYRVDRFGQPGKRLVTTGKFRGAPALLADGSVVAATDKGQLLIDGSKTRSIHLSDEALTSPAIAQDGTIYLGGDDGNLYAVNPDASLRWHFSAASRIQSSPAIGPDGTIYFGCNDGQFFALDPNGQKKWSHQTQGAFLASSPVVSADGTIVVASADKQLRGLNPQGQLLWSIPIDGKVTGSLAMGADGTLYFGCDDFRLYALR